MNNWQKEAKRRLQMELFLREISYKVLAGKLEKMGVPATERSIQGKISRGTFSFAFFLQCMKALGVTKIDLEK